MFFPYYGNKLLHLFNDWMYILDGLRYIFRPKKDLAYFQTKSSTKEVLHNQDWFSNVFCSQKLMDRGEPAILPVLEIIVDHPVWKSFPANSDSLDYN